MSKPQLLDLFCCSGGGARGYARAGFDVVGVDWAVQDRYPYEMVVDDALDVCRQLLRGHKVAGRFLTDFDVIHSSPPCQQFSQLSIARGDGTQDKYPNLLPETKELMQAMGRPYIIENVEQAPMDESAVTLCGTQFGSFYRWHRKFDCSFPVGTLKCDHNRATTYASPFTMPNYNRIKADFGDSINPEARFHKWRGIYWTNSNKEKREALPPVYTEYIGKEFLRNFKEH